ncbi:MULTISPECIES: hypothetical protein [Pseudomonas syringae group]|uniref:hypothetical protein n=1 Tax=Pseudomonas syringae group TaxID=136849 RepID=UPI00094399BF|nr:MULTISPECIES: hypothetical protein [Pseudomonas syringae group]
MNYYKIPSLSNIYLEDSYVLAVLETKRSLVFELEAVLTEKHPEYKKPRVGEKYCYKRVSLNFINADSVEWINKSFIAFTDASGDFDYGNIDSLISCDDGYEVTGDWGRVVIRGQDIEIIVE